MKNIFVICNVSNEKQDYFDMIETYASTLQLNNNINVFLPHKDINQNLSGFDICKTNAEAIYKADEVHVFYDPESRSIHFEMGMAFALQKKIKVVINSQNSAGDRSFESLLTEWEEHENNIDE